jgi:cytoskeletal protein CcmA (bactofilin family)
MAQEKNMFGRKGRRPETIRTLVGENAHVQGDLGFEGGCHIDGVINGGVDGSSDADAFLSVSEAGRVQGNVHVPRLALSGTVEGDVVVTERAELSATARVVGDVYYNLIEIEAGAEINGKLIHKVPAQPAQTKASAGASGDVSAVALSGAAKSAT